MLKFFGKCNTNNFYDNVRTLRMNLYLFVFLYIFSVHRLIQWWNDAPLQSPSIANSINSPIPQTKIVCILIDRLNNSLSGFLSLCPSCTHVIRALFLKSCPLVFLSSLPDLSPYRYPFFFCFYTFPFDTSFVQGIFNIFFLTLGFECFYFFLFKIVLFLKSAFQSVHKPRIRSTQCYIPLVIRATNKIINYANTRATDAPKDTGYLWNNHNNFKAHLRRIACICNFNRIRVYYRCRRQRRTQTCTATVLYSTRRGRVGKADKIRFGRVKKEKRNYWKGGAE